MVEEAVWHYKKSDHLAIKMKILRKEIEMTIAVGEVRRIHVRKLFFHPLSHLLQPNKCFRIVGKYGDQSFQRGKQGRIEIKCPPGISMLNYGRSVVEPGHFPAQVLQLAFIRPPLRFSGRVTEEYCIPGSFYRIDLQDGFAGGSYNRVRNGNARLFQVQ